MSFGSAMSDQQRAPDRLPREFLKIGAALVLGSATAMLDATVVAVATRTLALRFGSTLSAVAWGATADPLTMSLGVPLSGWALGRLRGGRGGLGGGGGVPGRAAPFGPAVAVPD